MLPIKFVENRVGVSNFLIFLFSIFSVENHAYLSISINDVLTDIVSNNFHNI